MVLATDSAKTFPPGRAWIILVLLALISEPGCARLRSFRQADERPAFGTDVASKAKGGKDRSPVSDDLYAERLAHSQEAVKPARRANQPPAIALQPPVAVAPVVAEEETATASVERAKEPPPESSPSPSPSPSPAPTLESILAQSRERLEGLNSYRVTMNHQERVGATLNPAEDIVVSIRRSPKAVRLEWPSGPHKGRDVLYSEGPDGAKGMMHVQVAGSPLPRMSMAPDSPLATMNSRHPITEAGFDTIIQNMELALEKQRAGDRSLGKIRLAGQERPEGMDKACYKVVRVTPSQETWVVYLDPTTNLPVLVEATAANGDRLERYAYGDPTFNPTDLAAADAFDPDARWGPAKGLFHRLARGGSTAPNQTETR